ncbi:MAG TPA: O-antigen ligase family protein [Mycobacteriales bacterium]|nr:O-antigen ligase family protein [Mycobacteriales bacterium]
MLALLAGNLPAAAALAACTWWLLLAPRLEGGRGAGAVTGGAILTALAVLASRPERVLPRPAVWLALAISVAAFGVAVLAPTGWAGAPTAASYVCASWTTIAVAAAVVRSPKLRNLVLLLVVGGVLIELAESWMAWWGGTDASVPISGTFYWYDPFAAFMLAGTVIGLSYWLRRSGPLALFGLVGAALGSIGMVYSTSRAAIACFAVAIGCVAVGAVWGRGRVGAKRLAIGAAVVGFAVWVIGGPPFFPHRSLPFAGTAGRAAGQSLGQNGSYRLEFWREALTVFRRHPLVGGGYHSLASAAVGHVPPTWSLSPLAHNGYLQALSDGGLLLGVPFLLALAAISWYVVAALIGAVRRRDFSTGGFVVPLCLGALLVHSAVDFDWSYAADFEVVAILAGLVAAARWAAPADGSAAERAAATGRPGARLLSGAVLVGVALLAVAAGVAHNGDFKQSLPIGSSASRSVVHHSTSGGKA